LCAGLSINEAFTKHDGYKQLEAFLWFTGNVQTCCNTGLKMLVADMHNLKRVWKRRKHDYTTLL